LCADVIDRAPAAYPATTLAEWKRISEQAAARDSVVTMDVLTELSQLITETISNITEFCSVWRSEEPGPMFHVDVKTRHHISLSYSSARTSAWQRDILPVVAGIVHHSEGILGPENQIVSTLKKEYPHSQTNYFSMAEVADLLQRLQATLSLR
jgi:hypothetical protein